MMRGGEMCIRLMCIKGHRSLSGCTIGARPGGNLFGVDAPQICVHTASPHLAE